MTVFALATRDYVLHVFPDAASALASEVVKANKAKGADDALLFFGADGAGLRHERGGGVDYLRPWASCSSCSLAQVTHLVTAVQGFPPLDTLEAITEYLAAKVDAERRS